MYGEIIKCAQCGEVDPVHLTDCPVAIAAEQKRYPAAHPNSRGVLLEEAAALIDGQRAKDYGDAHENFARIATGWSEIIGKAVSPAQVALCMDWLKTCRLITSPNHRDSWVDKAGYVALGGEIALP